ncbi:Methyltransferase domain-containing protein [Propionibacterium cyclohexanicum]|uniref:Methyltransferase domain-containing protein n=2 Tax=Propionibacterium cyclohexanicum TaxID=64702 RepID=A0A1H9TCD7_9ACTN|nr:Methyltransferase domain-containing protein [Propionibacterium cyclohexanicum]
MENLAPARVPIRGFRSRSQSPNYDVTMPNSAPHFPDAALEWLVGDDGNNEVLTLSPAAGLPRKLARRGHHVWCIDKDPARLQQMGAAPGLATVAARAEALPFAPCQFDLVLAHQIIHELAPGIAFGELARVLRPNGWVGVSYLTRDDSVPWVRRLMALMRSIDPEAMSADLGTGVTKQLVASKYFPHHEQRDFRIWIPVTRERLVTMTSRHRALASLPDREREQVLRAVGAIYDGAAAGSELRLPYQLSCWRAYVDHSEMTTPIVIGDDALVIPL